MEHFKVEFRYDCKICGKRITIPRFRTYCSRPCRIKAHNITRKEYLKTWQRKKRAEYAEDKIQCLICNGWYKQVCSHVYLTHDLNEKEYKQLIGRDRGCGIITQDLYDKRKAHNLANKKRVWANLEKGEPYRYVKGDTQAGRYKRSPETMARLKKIPFNLD